MYDELILRLRKDAEFLEISSKYNNTVNEFAERISQAADAIEKMSKQKWIPVKEHIPPEGKYVLVYGKGLYPNPNAAQIAVSEVYDKSYWSGFGRTWKITHWMPLPEPPKEET